MKKKALIIFMVTMMTTIAACGEPTIYVKSSSECNEEGNSTPTVTVVQKNGDILSNFSYVITANGYGLLCSGQCFSSEKNAIKNPIEINSAGYKITVTVSSSSGNGNTVMEAGDSKLISNGGYIYVVVN